MLISLEAAAAQFETTMKSMSCNPKYRFFIITKIKRDNVSMFDIDAFNKSQEDKRADREFCIDMVNFAEFVIDIIGEDDFFSKITTIKRQRVKEGFANSRFTLTTAELIKNTFDEWYSSYLNYEEVEPEYIPLEHRKPLRADYIKFNYWYSQKTTSEIAEELNVPQGWVIGEIRRLGLQKKANGIKVKSGHKDTTMSQEQREKRENQPHAKPIVQICPKTFKIIREYNSQGAVNRYGFSRENVRKALKRCGLSGGFLWAFKGAEQATINVAKRRTKIDVRVQVHEYVPPTKEELHNLYIVQGKSATQIAKKYGCHKGTIAQLAMKYELKKRTGKISIKDLKRLYIDEKLQAKEIAYMYGRTPKTIATYLSRSGIRR